MLHSAFLLAQSNGSSGGGILAGLGSLLCSGLVFLIFVAVPLAGLWKVFVKMGRPGWEGIVPIYNLYILTTVLGGPIWWFILALIPCTSIVGWIFISLELAKRFNKSQGYGIGIGLLPVVFLTMLGFGDDQFSGPAAGPGFPVNPSI